MCTGRLRQRLQRGPHRRPADRVEHAIEKQAAVLGGAHAQTALFGQPLLVAVVTRGVDRVLVVQDLLVELARRVLLRQWQELDFIEPVAQLVRRPTQRGQVSKADLARLHGRDGLRKLAFLLTHGEGVPDRVGVHVTVEAHPVGGRVVALRLPLV